MSKLLVTVGLPRSGKSTWAKEQGHPIVNPDSIRLVLHGQRFAKEAEPMVWVIAKYMVQALFKAGHKVVIVDATNITKARREQWISPEWETEFFMCAVAEKTCIERALAEGDLEIIPVIQRMARECDADMSNWV